jgi:hypothetical protein
MLVVLVLALSPQRWPMLAKECLVAHKIFCVEAEAFPER